MHASDNPKNINGFKKFFKIAMIVAVIVTTFHIVVNNHIGIVETFLGFVVTLTTCMVVATVAWIATNLTNFFHRKS